MPSHVRFCRLLLSALLLALVSWGPVAPASGEATKPTISVTEVPPAGGGPHRMETISGTVKNADPSKHRLVIFARTDRWYVQPFTSAPFTSIRADGSWTSNIHLGEEYAVLLVGRGYEPPATTLVLPRVEGEIIAVVRVPAANAAKPSSYSQAWPRVIEFSGFKWWVKRGHGRLGPGPNYFSDASESVWVDDRGHLHLRIRRDSGRWWCAEVVSQRSFGHGTYRFWLDSRADSLGSRAVLGMFTWSDVPEFHHREIDIEIARWGDPEAPNAQFVVQPWTLPENIFRFTVPGDLPNSMHAFRWFPDHVRFWSASGKATLQEWDLASGIPPAGGENARINFWLLGGLAPLDEQEMEVVIRQFDFVPLSASKELSNLEVLPASPAS